MIHYTVIFFVISMSAAVFGFAGINADAAGFARILCLVFLVLSVVSFIASTARSVPRAPSKKERARAVREARISELKDLFAIGQGFEYLGLRMCVTSRTRTAYSWDDCPGEPYALLCCEYVRDGKILCHEFTLEEARVLARKAAV